MDHCSHGAVCTAFFVIYVPKSARWHDKSPFSFVCESSLSGPKCHRVLEPIQIDGYHLYSPTEFDSQLPWENLVPNYFAHPFKPPRKNLLRVLPTWEINGYGQKVIFIAAPTLWNMLLLETASPAPEARNCSKFSFSHVPWMILSPN